jgi:hypothetical protein
MPNNIEDLIHSIMSRGTSSTVREIVQAVRQAIAAQIAGAPDVGVKRRPGRPRKEAAPTAAAAKPARKAPGKVKKRKSKQVAADDAKILAFIKGHPGVRSVDIQKEIKLPKQHIASGLGRLHDARKIKSKGERSRTTYSA